MIIDKEIQVKITRKNIYHYSTYYNNLELKDIISIDPLHLQPSSNIKINVSCDICNINRYIKYQAYNKNINSCKDHPIYTCDKCSHIKLKDYNKKHYGVEYYSQHPDRNEKVKKTSMEKYGAEHFSMSEYFIPKISKTNLEKFGYTNPFMDSSRIRRKFKEKYGVDHPSKVPEFKLKTVNTNIERYGVDNPLKSTEIRNKINNTNLLRYDGHYMKNDNFRYLSSIISRDKDYIRYIGENKSLFRCYLGHEFEMTSDLYHNRVRSSLPLCTICYPLSENNSIKEIELLKFIDSVYDGEVISNYRDVLEIDIYLPELKLGFEFNGLYWHSEEYKDRNYHLDKTKHFLDKDIRIIHIWEDDWDIRTNIIKSQISNVLGISAKIHARKCLVCEIDTKKAKNFINNNHIQGYTNSIKKYGLFYNNELVSVMTFDKSEGREKMPENEWNLSRFCNKTGISVIGGSSRLLKYFIKNEHPKRIISYADRSWSIGGLYNSLGFDRVSESNPDYKYIVGDQRIHKSRYRKSRINTNLSEAKYMKSNNILRIYDCGKIKFEKIL